MPVASEVTHKDERSPPTAPVDLAAVCPHAMKFKNTEDKGHGATQGQPKTGSEGPKSPLSNGHPAAEGPEVIGVKKTEENGQPGDKDVRNELYSLNLKLVLPGLAEPLNVLVTSSDTVNDLKQYVFDRQECCYRTCLSARFEGKKIEDYLHLNLIAGLKDGCTIKFVEEPYTQREVRLHVCRLRDLLNGPQLKGMFNGTNTETSLSFLRCVMGENPEVEAAKLSKPDLENLQNDPSLAVPQYCLPSSTPPLLPFYPDDFLEKWPECLKHLGYSQWNPPPSHRRMKGDLLYIDVTTLEGDEHCITASPAGFYLNKCQGNESFDPTPQKTSLLNHNLASLLFHISPLFKKNFSLIQRQMKKRSPFEVVPLPYPGAQPWLVPKVDHSQEQVPVEGVLVSRLGLDEHIFGQLKDWNGEFQQAKDLPQDTAADRITRYKNLIRMFSEFLHAAVKGAVNVVEGNIAPVNPSDDKKNYIYLWNNLFFSLAFDTAQINYKKYGGDEAAHRACSADINGIAYLNMKNVEGLHTVETAVIDIKGNRVVAQSVVPGLLQSDPESFIVYGSMDNTGSNFKLDSHFTGMLRKVAEVLHIREHRVVGPGEEVLSLPSSIECKGMRGTDGRYYVMDLYKLFPEDANFMTQGKNKRKVEGEDHSLSVSPEEKGAQQGEEPFKLRHKLMTVRPELVDKFIKNKYMMFVNTAIRHIQESHTAKDTPTTVPADETDGGDTVGEIPGNSVTPSDSKDTPLMDPLQHMASDPVSDQSDVKMREALQKLKEVGGEAIVHMEGVVPRVEPSVDVVNDNQVNQKKAEMEEKVLEGVRRAAEEVGSSLKDGFEILFNVDFYTPEVKHADSEELLERDEKLLTELAGFLGNKVLSIFIYDCAELLVTPWDGEMLTSVMHSRGINMRYLGGIAKSIQLLKEHVHLDYLYNIVVMEMILRVAKRLFRRELQRTPYHSCGGLLAHLLNCFLGKVEGHPEPTKKKQKKKKKSSLQNQQESSPTTTVSMWTAICKEVTDHFRYTIEYSCADALCEKLSVSKLPLLRGICNKVGIQLFLKNYNLFEATIFTEDDIAGIFPIVKHPAPRCQEGEALMGAAEAKLNSGQVQEAAELLMEALSIFNSVFGPVHELIGSCNRTLARIHFVAGQHSVALSYQQRAAYIIERVHGVDHRSTIAAYIQLAMYCHECGQTSVALRLMYRSRYLMKLIYGEGHPEVAVCDVNLAVMLNAINHTKSALMFLENALQVNKKYLGESSFHVGMNHHLMAQWMSTQGDFRGALRHEKAANGIFEAQLGSGHNQTKESYECMKVLTEKAVVMQKKINEFKVKFPGASDKIQESSGCSPSSTAVDVSNERTVHTSCKATRTPSSPGSPSVEQ